MTKVSDANSQQVIKRSTSATPSQQAQQTTTSMTTPTGQSTRTENTIGATPAAARDYGSRKTLFHSYQIIWYLFAFVEIVLAFRFILKLLGANPEAGFTKFMYGLSAPFAGPFLTIFHASSTQGVETTSFFEWSTIVAAIVYIVITWGVMKIFKLGKPTTPREIESSVESQ